MFSKTISRMFLPNECPEFKARSKPRTAETSFLCVCSFLSLSSRKGETSRNSGTYPAQFDARILILINHALRELTTTRIHLFDFHIRRTQPDDVVR